MRILDLASGLNGATAAARDRGADVFVFGVDNDPKLPADMTADLTTVTASDILDAAGWDSVDYVWASPPCQGFSVASIGKMWNHDGTPKHPTAFEGLRVLRSVLGLVDDLKPYGWVMENPRGFMRKVVPDSLLRGTVSYCHFGEDYRKPTDLWGQGLADLSLAGRDCHNRQPGHAADCCCTDHVAASRGAKVGTQGIGARDGFSAGNWRSVVPFGVSQWFQTAVEADWQANGRGSTLYLGATG